MKQLSSPNFDKRDPNVSLDFVVLHYTGMKDEESALARLCDPASRVSAHYVIGENGNVAQLVDEDLRAWHAGASFWRGTKDMNSASIGIELVNPGHEFGYRAFPDAQIAALRNLLRDIVKRRRLNAETMLLAHSDIAPSRKQDPGELFPWQSLAQDGFGCWPTPTHQDALGQKERNADYLLDFIGYDTSDIEVALQAFQRRFCPQSLGKGLDLDSLARLRALACRWGS